MLNILRVLILFFSFSSFANAADNWQEGITELYLVNNPPTWQELIIDLYVANQQPGWQEKTRVLFINNLNQKWLGYYQGI